MIRSLFPKGKVFRLVIDNNLKKLIKSLAVLPADIRKEVELAYSDIFPDTTRYPEMWEKTFGVLFSESQLTKRRAILDALWKLNGGQSAYWIQYLLQQVDEKIEVVENTPVRNPRDSNVASASVNFNKIMNNGDHRAINNYRVGDETFVPTVLVNGKSDLYSIPNDSRFWESCFFVCGGVSRNSRGEILYVTKITVNAVWKEYVEYLVLKIKPAHTRAVMFIEWTN
jgi:hypothetical protein